MQILYFTEPMKESVFAGVSALGKALRLRWLLKFGHGQRYRAVQSLLTKHRRPTNLRDALRTIEISARYRKKRPSKRVGGSNSEMAPSRLTQQSYPR